MCSEWFLCNSIIGCWILQRVPIQHWLKYILQLCYNQNREPWLCRWLCATFMYIRWVRKLSTYLKLIVHYEKKRKQRILHCNQEIHKLHFGLKQVRSPFLKVPWWEPKMFHYFTKHKDNKIFPIGNGNKFKRNFINQSPFKISLTTITIPDWNCYS